MAITAADIKRGLRVRVRSNPVGVLFQATWEKGDSLDTFILVGENARVFRPEYMNAAQMAMYLTEHGFEVVDD